MMAQTSEVSADWIVHALVRGRMAEKLEAQRMLESPRVKVNGASVRRLLMDAISQDHPPDADDNNAEAPSIRCWLLGALGRVADVDGKSENLLLKHVDRSYEPNPWARYWALEALLRRAQLLESTGWSQFNIPRELTEACRKMTADPREHALPKMLATAVLARNKSSDERKTILAILADEPQDAEKKGAALAGAARPPLRLPSLCRVADVCLHRHR